MLNFPYCKLEIFLPASHLSALQEALAQVDAGHIGNYDTACPTPPLPAAGNRCRKLPHILVRSTSFARHRN